MDYLSIDTQLIVFPVSLAIIVWLVYNLSKIPRKDNHKNNKLTISTCLLTVFWLIVIFVSTNFSVFFFYVIGRALLSDVQETLFIVGNIFLALCALVGFFVILSWLGGSKNK